jgi:hypothetical protein
MNLSFTSLIADATIGSLAPCDVMYGAKRVLASAKVRVAMSGIFVLNQVN